MPLNEQVCIEERSGGSKTQEWLCNDCRKIDLHLFTVSGSPHKEYLGTLDYILKRNCVLCKLICRALPPCPNWLLPNGTNSRLCLSSSMKLDHIVILEDKMGGSAGELRL